MKHLVALLLFVTVGAQVYAIEVKKDIPYSQNADNSNLLDVYADKKSNGQKDVIVFIHGGSWRTGDKKMYSWLGKNFARKGLVAVMINYSLSPYREYDQMAADCAKALKWISEHIPQYSGNSSRIFVMGHSAGGHLGELINADPRYFKAEGIKNPIRGVILNDAFGLDIYQYLSTDPGEYYHDFIETFTSKPETWKTASPFTYISNITNPHLILVGGKTYPAIQMQSGCLYEDLLKRHIAVRQIWRPHKKHIGMIAWMYLGWSPQYRMILDFMKQN